MANGEIEKCVYEIINNRHQTKIFIYNSEKIKTKELTICGLNLIVKHILWNDKIVHIYLEEQNLVELIKFHLSKIEGFELI